MIHLETPLKSSDITQLKAGDLVYISGTIVTARDKAHDKALKEGNFPVDVAGGALFHAGPIVKREVDGWNVIAIGPTTSSRLDGLESDFMKSFGVKAVIGKGGMDPEIFKKHKSVYLAMTGGCAALGAESVNRVEEVFWLDLGVPEAVWVIDFNELGPLLVAIDSKGNSLYR